MRRFREVRRQGESKLFAKLYEEDGCRMYAYSPDKEIEERLNSYLEKSLECGKHYGKSCSMPQHIEEIEETLFNYISRTDRQTTFILSNVIDEEEEEEGTAAVG